MPKKIPQSQCLNNFLFDILYNSSQEERKELPTKYRMATKNFRTTQAFINKTSQEEKQELLTLLGVQWLLIFFDRGKPQKRLLKEVFEKYRGEDNTVQSKIENAIKDRIYVMSDASFFNDLGLMGMIVGHNVYKQNLLLRKVGYHVQRWQKKLSDKDTQFAEQDAASVKYFSLSGFHFMIAYDFSKELFGVLPGDLKILHYLYSVRHKYVDCEEIFDKLSEAVSKHKITGSIRRLFDGQLVQKSLKEKKYTISALGVKKIMDVVHHILKSNEINKG